MTAGRDEQISYLFPDAYLRNFSAQVFIHFGVPRADAEQAADVFAKSDLRGIDSHGVARLHTYFEMLELGRINPKPRIKIVREKASVATVDGDNGLGLVVGPKANEIAMDKAERHGSGWVSVCNTNHFGIAGYYPFKSARTRFDRLGDDQLRPNSSRRCGARSECSAPIRSPSRSRD